MRYEINVSISSVFSYYFNERVDKPIIFLRYAWQCAKYKVHTLVIKKKQFIYKLLRVMVLINSNLFLSQRKVRGHLNV